MNRIAFHIFAAVLLIVVVAFLGVRVRLPALAPDPQAQLIALMKSSGLDYLGARKMVSNETNQCVGTPVDWRALVADGPPLTQKH